MNHRAFNPFDPAVVSDPYPYYTALRRTGPVVDIDSLGLRVVSRFDDVQSTLQDTDGFVPVNDDSLGAAAGTRYWTHTTSGGGCSGPSAGPIQSMLQEMSGAAIDRKRVVYIDRAIREAADELIDVFVGRQSFDLVSDYSELLPIYTVCRLFGIAPADHAKFVAWAKGLVKEVVPGAGDVGADEFHDSFLAMHEYFDAMIESRNVQRTDDWTSEILRWAGEGTAVSAADVVPLVCGLLVSGHEVTSNAISNGLLALLSHPESYAAVRMDGSFISAVVDEVFRYDAPVQMVVRRATRPSVVGGTAVQSGDTLGLLIGSANRDDVRFRFAERFDPWRLQRGPGPIGAESQCATGTFIIRRQTEIGLSVLFERLGHLGRIDRHVNRNGSLRLRGPKHLPLRFVARDA